MLKLFGAVASIIGLVLIGAGTVLSAPSGEGDGWWTMLAGGALLSIIAALTALLDGTVGGLLAVIGGALVLIGAALGFPLTDDA
jgi:hypothetical protein